MAAHVPVRMCVVCRKRRPKSELLRHVHAATPGQEPAPVADPAQHLPGRGWYVCPEADCREALARRGGGGRARRRIR